MALGMSAEELDYRMRLQEHLDKIGVEMAEILFIETKHYLDEKIREDKLK